MSIENKQTLDFISSHDFEELNDEITKLVSLMAQCEEDKNECDQPLFPTKMKHTAEEEKLEKLLDTQFLYISPIWKNTNSFQPSHNSFSTSFSSSNSSFNSNPISPVPSPNRLFVSAYSPIMAMPYTKVPQPFYSMNSNCSKYDSAFNSNQENVHVPRLDNEKNLIHLHNIFTGQEHRTTLMIRHIPNKYTLKVFSEEINKKFRGKYDVLYLPIDYTNNCNLGFAFINFVDPMHIIDFYETFRGKKWSKYLSDKRCELAFAKIQGKQNLMSHFEKGNVLHYQTEDKKPLILSTPNPLPFINFPLKFETALKECYPHAAYYIDSKQGSIVLRSFNSKL